MKYYVFHLSDFARCIGWDAQPFFWSKVGIVLSWSVAGLMAG